ncbi:TatD family hydrolase [Candidatus Neomarinimicrobiota bacterium]
MLIDTHAHLFYKDYHGRMDEVVAAAAKAGVDRMLCVGLDIETSRQSIALADEYPNIWATVGVHPHDSEGTPEDIIDQLRDLASHPKVVAIGEMGLDYFRDYAPRDIQQKLFTAQLELAAELDMPAIVHNRDADRDLLSTMRGVGHTRGVVHCFSSPPVFAGEVLDFGFHISFTGTVTFGKNHNAAVLRQYGLERVMVETDCPYLTPNPYRGKINEPAYTRFTAEKIGLILGFSLNEVGSQTTANAERLFPQLGRTIE